MRQRLFLGLTGLGIVLGPLVLNDLQKVERIYTDAIANDEIEIRGVRASPVFRRFRFSRDGRTYRRGKAAHLLARLVVRQRPYGAQKSLDSRVIALYRSQHI